MKALMFSWNGEVDALQFDSDIYFLQRWKERYTKDERIEKYNHHYVNNYGKRGLCIIDKKNKLDIDVGRFTHRNEHLTDECQGQYWQTLKLGKYKIINASICYPDPDRFKGKVQRVNIDSGTVPWEMFHDQGKELLSMIDDDTLIVTDLHFPDDELDQETEFYTSGLIKNHLKDSNAFTNHNNVDNSLDKLLTTQNSNISISNINVIKCKKEQSDFGHWPIQFEIQFA